MIKILKSDQRGISELSWLKSWHTFSFGNYFNRHQMGFKTLRVINQDIIAPSMGFGTHPHKDMEIITYLISGELAHQDSMGQARVLKPGQLQKMSAGSGVSHSEFNASNTEPAHLMQIWIHPREKNLPPSYDELPAVELTKPGLTLVVSPEENSGVLHINQDAEIFLGNLKNGESCDYQLSHNSGVWLQLISGSLQIADYELESGDALSAEAIDSLKISASTDAKFLLFDLK